MVTWSDLGDSLWVSSFLFLVSSFVFVVVLAATWLFLQCVPGYDRIKRTILASLFGGLPLGFTGIVCGFLTGSSKTPAVSALVPAALTLIGLMVVYLLGKGLLRSAIAGLTVFVFSMNLVTGTVLGNTSRNRFEELRDGVDSQKFKAVQELAVRRFRTALGLPPEPPKPVVQSADK